MASKKPRQSGQSYRDSRIIDFEAARKERQKRRAAQREKAHRKQSAKRYALSKSGTGKRNRRKTIYIAVILMIFAVIGASAFNTMSVKMDYEEELAKQAALLSEKEMLSEELANVDNPEYIEQQARMMLRMIRPGEQLYVLPPQSDARGQADEGQ